MALFGPRDLGWRSNISIKADNFFESQIFSYGGPVDDPPYSILTSLFYVADDWVLGEPLVSSKDLLTYFKDYNSSYYSNNGNKVCGYSPDLFDLNKSYRYVIKTSNINDSFSLDSYYDTHNAFQRWWDYGFTSNQYNKTIANAKYIESINSSSFLGSNVSDTLLVQEEFIEELQSYYDDVSVDNNVYLLRFAYADDYYSGDIVCGEVEPVEDLFGRRCYNGTQMEGDFMFCQANVYLNFDFIEFGFGDETDLTIIPAVLDPVDIAPDIIPTDPDIMKPDSIFPDLGDLLGSEEDDNIWIIALVVVLIIMVVVIVIILLLKNPQSVTVITEKAKEAANNVKNRYREQKTKRQERRKNKSEARSSGKNKGNKRQNRYRENNRRKKQYRSRNYKR